MILVYFLDQITLQDLSQISNRREHEALPPGMLQEAHFDEVSLDADDLAHKDLYPTFPGPAPAGRRSALQRRPVSSTSGG